MYIIKGGHSFELSFWSPRHCFILVVYYVYFGEIKLNWTELKLQELTSLLKILQKDDKIAKPSYGLKQSNKICKPKLTILVSRSNDSGPL